MPRDKTLSHKKIIRAATEEFAEYGYEKASMRRIGKRCGLTAAALYRHFDSKEAMFDALVKPALSEADAGVAVNTGAAIAREIADITIEAEDLGELLVLRDISKALMHRIDADYRVIISLNSMLILLGAFGIITPAASAAMHNLSTIGISLYNMTDLIEA